MRRKYTLEQREQIHGYLYVAPFIIGFVFLFLYPMVQSIIYSFGTLDPNNNFKLVFEGLKNYRYALKEDTVFYRDLITSVKDMFIQLPIILIFSFIMANLLKANFAGRGIIRMIFFLPVVLSSGIVTRIESNNVIQGIYNDMVNNQGGLFSDNLIQQFLLDLNLSTSLVTYLLNAISDILETVNNSGIQILIFLAALQSISPSLYEASSIEGASAWENFWKITFPIVMPQLIVCVVYTVVERFVNVNNKLMIYIYDVAYTNLEFGLSFSMSWMYTIVVIAVLLIFLGVFTKANHYYDR